MKLWKLHLYGYQSFCFNEQTLNEIFTNSIQYCPIPLLFTNILFYKINSCKEKKACDYLNRCRK